MHPRSHGRHTIPKFTSRSFRVQLRIISGQGSFQVQFGDHFGAVIISGQIPTHLLTSHDLCRVKFAIRELDIDKVNSNFITSKYLLFMVCCGMWHIPSRVFWHSTSHPSQIKVSRKRWFIYLPGLYLHPRPIPMADSAEEVNVGGKKPVGNIMFATLYCAIFRTSSLREFHRLFPTTVQAPAFSILSAMFTGACDPPES